MRDRSGYRTCESCQRVLKETSFPAPDYQDCRACHIEKVTNGRFQRVTPERKKVKVDRQNRTPASRYAALRLASVRATGQLPTITREEHAALLALPCHYCGLSTNETGTGLDRKEAGVAYSLENVVPACWFCNSKKAHLFTYDEMVKFIGPAIRAARLSRVDRNEDGTE